MNAGSLVALAVCFAAAAALAMGPVTDRLALVPDTILIGFDEPESASRWVTVNDNVMGGRSVGGFSIGDGRLDFSGSTNTNGGGFSSIRTRSTDLNLDGTDGLLYRVRGDGRTYIAGLRTGARFGSFDVSYWAKFDTNGSWQTVRIPFDAFYPTMFGEDISGRAPELRAEDIAGAEFYIYDKKDGPFRLEIEWIGSYTDSAVVANAESGWDQHAGRAGAADGHSAVAARGGEAKSDPKGGPNAGQDGAARAQSKVWASMVLGLAIERGVPQFNAGNQGACADIYEVAIASLVLNRSMLPRDAVALLESGLRAGTQAGSHADRAWAYRYAMDAALGLLMDPDSKPDSKMDPMRSVWAD